uniref:CCHC-type domain-containing protein n=1 Tax=Triticum urartu TaxID=4572 RepID=A0A8R7UH56_TRIUA
MRFGNCCFRCLASRHKAFECRDPAICYTCRKTGHLERSCPVRLAKAKAKAPAPACPASAAPQRSSSPPTLPLISNSSAAGQSVSPP